MRIFWPAECVPLPLRCLSSAKMLALVMTLVMALMLLPLASAAYATEQEATAAATVAATMRRQRKLVDPMGQVQHVEPEMLLFGSRMAAIDGDADADDDLNDSTLPAMPAPFAKAPRGRQTPSKAQRPNARAFGINQRTNSAYTADDRESETSESVELYQQRPRARAPAATHARTVAASYADAPMAPTQRQRQQTPKRNRNNASVVHTVNMPHAHIVGTGGTASGSRSKSSRRKAAAAATTTTSTTTTTTQAPHLNIFENFQRNNPFNFFSTQFWNAFNPPSSTTETAIPTTAKTTAATYPATKVGNTAARKPPKKYQRATPTAPIDKEQKYSNARKVKTTTAASSSSAQKDDDDNKQDGPLRIALPTLSLFDDPPKPTDNASKVKDKEKRATVAALRERYVCPRESEVRFQLFPKICNIDKDCSIWQRDEICCDIFGAKSCVTGKPKPLEESSHAPILGVIPRKCPTRPLAELWWEVKECDTDMDCWPRICCPDGRRRYCRTSQPELDAAPVPVKRSFNYLTEYLECTAPPPPIFDLHPRACTSTLDCFPNVCCQEAGLRHCRPPKKSVLTLMANFLNVDFVKRLTQNIVIK